MVCIEQYAVSYPLSEHPVLNEKPDFKAKYVSSLEYFRKKFCNKDIVVQARFERFKEDFFKNVSTIDLNIEKILKEAAKTRFKSFKVFSYRYMLLFDSIFLFAPANLNLAQAICNELKSVVHRRHHNKLDLLVSQMFKDAPVFPENLFIPQKVFEEWIDLRKFFDGREKSIVLTATMSAGKSTLINAIIGQDLSPAKKMACTSEIIKFYSAPAYNLKYHMLADDAFHPNLLPDEIYSFTNETKKPCSIIGSFYSKVNKQKICIIDTPGVNSAQNPSHKEITRKALLKNTNDIIVYIISLDYYESDDEFHHLEFINKQVSYKKIIFVVNMMDNCSPYDESIDEIMKNISEYLKSIGFKEPVICPISAKAGLLFKKALKGEDLPQKEKKALLAFYLKYENPDYDLSKYYGNTGPDDFNCKNYQMAEISHDELYQAYLRTGFSGFESVLFKNLQEV
ncbi:MAG TPA: dynamin family protein [Oscillospiraceae bacterium]|nr:dynamin family protein [Oscillospiraceae bacterium]